MAGDRELGPVWNREGQKREEKDRSEIDELADVVPEVLQYSSKLIL